MFDFWLGVFKGIVCLELLVCFGTCFGDVGGFLLEDFDLCLEREGDLIVWIICFINLEFGVVLWLCFLWWLSKECLCFIALIVFLKKLFVLIVV